VGAGVQLVFALIFTVARIIVGPFLTYYTVVSPTSHPVVKAGAVGILGVSLLWFHKIVGLAMGALGGDKKKAKSKEI
jgi:hypothetical protein